MYSLVSLFAIAAALCGMCGAADNGADCPYRTYAGGEVYPMEWPRSHDHSLHYSKALSKLTLKRIKHEVELESLPCFTQVRVFRR